MRYGFILLFLSALLGGCAGRQNRTKPLEKVKVGELIPKDLSRDKRDSIVGFCIYVFQVDRDKYQSVLEAINEANDLAVEHKDADGFSGNGLISGGGDIDTWREFAPALVNAETRIVKRINLYTSENTNNDVLIADELQPISVCYHSGRDATAGVGLEAGTIRFLIRVNSVIGPKQICSLNITPVYKATSDSSEKLRINMKRAPVSEWDFVFSSAGLGAKIQPGQFVCIAPRAADFSKEGLSLVGELMFLSDNPKPAVRFCLIACSLIND